MPSYIFAIEGDKAVEILSGPHENTTRLLMDTPQRDLEFDRARPVEPEELMNINGSVFRKGEWVPRELTTEELKLKGFNYNGTWCSVTKEDQWGLNSVESMVLAGYPVYYHFANGNKLLLHADMWSDFRMQWIGYRLSFFPLPTA